MSPGVYSGAFLDATFEKLSIEGGDCIVHPRFISRSKLINGEENSWLKVIESRQAKWRLRLGKNRRRAGC